MPQLHLYVSEDLALRLRERAEARGLSLSRYLAELVGRELGSGWPEGYFDAIAGGWRGEPLERAPQGAFEVRGEM